MIGTGRHCLKLRRRSSENFIILMAGLGNRFHMPCLFVKSSPGEYFLPKHDRIRTSKLVDPE